ncbi:hypothetical protein DCC62_06590 [candidate division KSB1 bacterium]|nr:MAG: hypothetical protein DCC62_06590 [candidate division KSB1 bacterium]
MPITFFQTLNAVLTKGVSDICQYYGVSKAEAIQRAKQYLGTNSAAYYSDNAQLQYQDPLCRIAYLYSYVGAHANLVDNAFYKFSELREFVANQFDTYSELQVCSLGGGPGSELLGFVKFIERERRGNGRVDVNFTLIDKVCQWDETWQVLVNGLHETFKINYGMSRQNWPIVVNRSFLPLDLAKATDFQNFPARFSDVQVYVLNHTVSEPELLAHRSEFQKTFKEIVTRASTGAFFVFIDRNQEAVVAAINRLANVDGLALINNTFEKTNMDLDEEKRDLGEWYDLMGRDPKLKWNAYYALARKTE